MSQKRKYFNNRTYTKQILTQHKDEIFQRYLNGDKPREIGDSLGIEEYSIYNFIRKNNIPTKKPYAPNEKKLDDDYFENIDSFEKAYFLGWLMSDGNVDEQRGYITLTLQSRDRKIIELFKNALKSEHKLSIRLIKNLNGYGKSKIREIATISFHSKKMCSDLNKLGCTQRKSLTLKFPKIEEKFIFSFLRGYIEGDGWICGNKINDGRCPFNVGFVATKEFLEYLFSFLIKYDYNFCIYQNKNWKKGINLYAARLSNRSKVIEFLEKIYENCNNLYLDRKYNKYLKLKELFKLNPPKYKVKYITKTKYLFK